MSLPTRRMKFERRFWSKADHFTANLGGSTIKNVSEMELYIILSILEKNLWWNQF